MIGRSLAASLLLAGTVLFGAACSSSSDDGDGAASCDVPIDRFKELMIVEESVVNDPRASNTLNGPWSFRHALEGILPPAADHSEFIISWLQNWVLTTEVNGFKTDRESRAEEMNRILLCPWLKLTPANNCDDTCNTCAGRELDLAKAPFRLRAIVNRLDLRNRPDTVSPAGEGRLVYAMTRGPADDPASEYLAFSMVFEYGLPPSLDDRAWAEAWHHLGTHPDFGEEYKTELAELTERFVMANAWPERKNGSALARVRTNESAFNWIWQLRQFQLDSSGQLRLSTTDNTPGEALNGSKALREYILANAEAIKADKHVVPRSMLAGSADQLVFRWTFPGVDEPLRLAFSRGTCNGCHTGENPAIDTAFHISPYRQGIEKLSRHVNDPSAPDKDELGLRTRQMADELCGKL